MANVKKPIKKSLRFEVLKRDKFTCQYCGAAAPDVLLHVDHVIPEAEGGDTSMLNLVASCSVCNLGKGARPLDDGTAISKQRAQIDRLAGMREQVALMIEWRAELATIQEDLVTVVVDELLRGTRLNALAADTDNIRRWLKRIQFPELLASVEEALSWYVKSTPATNEQFDRVMKAIPKIAASRKNPDHEYRSQASYIRGILKNRHSYTSPYAVELITEHLKCGGPFEEAKAAACSARSWTAFCDALDLESGTTTGRYE